MKAKCMLRRGLVIPLLLLLLSFSRTGFAQAETHDFITYDTTVTFYSGAYNQYQTIWTLRISRPANMFTPNHPDTASRPLILTMPGMGEVGTNPANLEKFGPHYWIKNGWDGGVQLANGKHFPILITMLTSVTNVRANETIRIFEHILNTYRVKRGSIHIAGLSMGGMALGSLVTYARTAGDKWAMANIKSYTSLQGLSSVNYNGVSWGDAGFGIWASEFDGRFFGLEGTGDTRNVWMARDAMALAGKPENAYFSFENLGNGQHCCWNDMYNPSRRNWKCTGTPLGANIAVNTFHPNSMGSYKDGWSLFEWMIRQGDTTLVGTQGTPPPAAPPTVNAGPSQALQLPLSLITLSGTASANGGNTLTSTTWSKVSGPACTIVLPGLLNTTVIGIGVGNYVFKLTARDNAGQTSEATTNVSVLSAPLPAAPVMSAGAAQTITLPVNSVQLTGTATGELTSSAWSQDSGPTTATIVNAANLATTVSDLEEGVYTFKLTGTNAGGSSSSTVKITVNAAAPVAPPVVNAGSAQTITLPANSATLTGTVTGEINSVSWTQESGPSTATIDDETSLSTAVSGLQQGVYVFKLAVSNNGGTGSSTVTVTVNSAPVGAPVMNAGAAQTITLPANTVTLTGTVQGTITSSTWSQESGPNTATIVNATDLVTVVNGLVEGVYVFKLSGTNSGGNNSATVTITVNAAPVAAPVVNAGAAQTITLPLNLVTLTGTVQGALTSSTWSQESGPTTATIVSAGSLITVVNGLTQGVYVFKLSGTNSGGSNSATVTITVNAAVVTAPVMSAGADQAVILPANSVSLTGSVQGTLTNSTWSQESGPNTATIVTPGNLTTTISGLVEGVYIFKLTGTNSGGTHAATVKVTVEAQNNQPPPVTPVEGVKVAVGQGEYQTLFIDKDGHLWGLGNLSNIGTNAQGPVGVTRRVQVTPFDLKFKFAMGALHGAAAVDENGNVWTMGDNEQGQMGMGDLINNIVLPRKILIDEFGAPFTNVASLASYFVRQANGYLNNGYYAVKTDGSLWVWGSTLAGMRGNGTDNIAADSFTKRPSRIIIPGGRLVQQVVAGQNAIALCTDGTVWTWGGVSKGNLGYNSQGNQSLSPQQLTGLTGIKQIAGGIAFNYALKSDGTLYGWGMYGSYMGEYAAIGGGPTKPVPVVLNKITDNLPAPIKKIVTNSVATHAILTDGSLWGWGDNAQGTVGNGQELNYAATEQPYSWDYYPGRLLVQYPYNVAPTIKFANVFGSSVYTFYTYAVDENGQLYCWGRNKASVLANRVVTATPSITAAYPNGFDVPWPKPVDPFTITSNVISTSPLCITNGNGTACNTYPVPANTRPKSVPGTNQTINTTTATLNGAGSTDNVYISYYIWSQVSGPNSAIMDLPGAPVCRLSGLATGVYTFKLKVIDNGWLSDSATVQVAVNATIPANQPPVSNAGQDKTITLPVNTVTLTGTGTDPNGMVTSYLWTKVSGPNQFAIVNPTQAQTAINNLVEGIYQFELKVTDNEGATATDIVVITVKAAAPPANQAPVAIPGANKVITLPVNTVTMNGSGTDADGTVVGYQWTKVAGPNQFTIVSPTQAQTVINNLVQGVYRFELRVTDNTGATDKDTVTVTVNPAPPPANQAPVANAGSNKVITLPVNTVSLSGSGTDADGTITGYQWTKISGPVQLTIVSPTQAQTVVNNLVEGVYRFALRVTDNQGATGSDTITVTVNATPPVGNQAPLANAGPNKLITLPVNTVSVTGSGTDTDGTIAGYQWTKIAGPAQFAIATPTQATTAINNLIQGVYQFELRVTDNQGAVGRDTMTVTVNAAPVVNQAPIAYTGANLSITLPVNTVAVNGNGSQDPDGTIVSYLWEKIAGPAQFTIATPAQVQTSFNNLVQGVYQFSLTVTDNNGATGKDTMTVTVNAAPVPNNSPIALVNNDIVITLPTNAATANGSGSYDPDGSIAAYQWTKIAGPGQFVIAAPTQAQTAISGLVQGVYKFELRVTDNKGAMGRDTLTITVNAAPQPNQLPVANAGNNVTITLPTNSLTVNGTNSYDPDGNIVAYQWTKIAGPAQSTIVAATQAQTSVNSLVQGVYKFELRVTDNSGGIGRDTVTITVNPGAVTNLAPIADAGADRVITLPVNSLTMTGIGVDADGTVTAYQWTKISGPSQFTIATPTQKNTVISNLVLGVYQFELRVTDDKGATGKDTVSVTVVAQPVDANKPPVADAGADRTVSVPDSIIRLDASKSYDPDGQIVSYIWQQVDGPAQSLILNPNAAVTNVDATVAGTYRFQVTVTDNKGAQATDEVEIIVLAPESSARVFPNPVSSVLNLVIESSTMRNRTDVQIFDARGNRVYQEQFMRDLPRITRQIDVTRLAKGVYFIKVQVDINHAKTVQFLKQ